MTTTGYSVRPEKTMDATMPRVDTRDKLMDDLAEQLRLSREGQAVIAELLKKLDRRLTPSHDFYPARQTIAGGDTWTFDPGIQPLAWFVALDADSTARLDIKATNDASAWIRLAPGAHVIFPARSQTITVTNVALGDALTTIAALGDVPFEYATQ